MEYNEFSIECSYILNLLANFYVPTIRVISNEGPAKLFDNEIYLSDKGIYKWHNESDPTLIDLYELGKNYLCLSRNYIATSDGYTPDLHEALGRYLRFLKAYYNFDIMPLYNCFSNRFIDNFSLPISNERPTGTIPKAGKTVTAFPVEFESSYEIYCKGNTAALIQLVMFNGKKPLEIELNAKDGTNSLIVIFKSQNISLSQYEGYTYTTPELNENTLKESLVNSVGIGEEDIKILLDNRRYLYLFIELPIENSDNFVIIENNSTIVINNTLIRNNAQKPYSNKLLGYLLNYYISPITKILTNILKIQELLSSKDYYAKTSEGKEVNNIAIRLKLYIPGYFDDNTRSTIYNLFRFADIADFTGYVDNDVEALLMKENKDG